MLSKNQIKDLRALHLKKHRDAERLFIAEGVKTVSEIIESRPDIVDSVYGVEKFSGEILRTAKKKKIPVYGIEKADLEKISLQSTPNNVLAVCRHFEPEVPSSSEAFSFYLDDIRDPGNFGTILRVCDWFGIRTLNCSANSCELFNPKVIQSSMGAFLRVKVVYSEPQTILAGQKGTVYGAYLDGENIYDIKLQPGVIVIGNEANGIGEASGRYIKKRITIPSGSRLRSESLNAAMATSIIASEFFRQFRKSVF